jgi:hypothetical protein
MTNGLSRKLWTTRDLQEAAAAGALFEGFESEDDFLSDDFLSEDFVSEDDDEAAGVEEGVVEAPDVLLAGPERLSVR